VALRSVLAIDVDTTAFDALAEKFNKFKAAAEGGVAAKFSAAGAAGGGGKVDAAAVDKVAAAHERSALAVDRARKSWGSIKDLTTSIGRTVTTMARDMVKVTGMMGLVGGLATGFGFLGMDVLGKSASGWRRQALGQGASIGGMRAFDLNFSRFVDPNAVMAGVGQAQRDITKSVPLRALGITPGAGEDTADVAARVIAEVQKRAKATPDAMLGQLVQTMKLGDIGLGLEDVTRLKRMSPEEMAQQQKAFRGDRASLDLKPEDAKNWQNFTTALQRARQNIETTFVVGLSGLTGPLTHLSEGFNKLLASILSSPKLKGWLDDLAVGIEHFATYIGTPEFQKDVEDFVAKVGELARAVGSAVEWIISKVPITPGAPGLFDPLQINPKREFNPFGLPEPVPLVPPGAEPGLKKGGGHWDGFTWVPDAAGVLPPAPPLSDVNIPGGKIHVASDARARFQGLADDLVAGGYAIDPKTSGGYNRRFIAGTNIPSQHAFGQAVDFNSAANPHGEGPSTMPPALARSLAAKWGMTWGGDWTGKDRDTMHFELMRAQAATTAASGSSTGWDANNPLNLRTAQGGVVTPGGVRLAKFPSMSLGIMANLQKLQDYQSKGLNTVEQMVSMWEYGGKKPGDPDYIKHVSAALGVRANQAFDIRDPKNAAAWLRAAQPHESGPGRLSPEDIAKGVSMASGRHVATAMRETLGAVGRGVQKVIVVVRNETGGNAVVSTGQIAV
jgi:hypothetical protein